MTVDDAAPVVFPVVGGLASRGVMGYLIGHGVDGAPGGSHELLDIRGEVADHVLFLILLDGFLPAVGVVLIYRVHFVQDFVQLVSGDHGVGQVVGFLIEVIHILFTEGQHFPGFFNLGVQVADVSGFPLSGGAAEGQVQGVIADYTDGGYAGSDGAGSVMGIGEAEVRVNFVSGHLRLGEFGKEPDGSAVPQAAGGFVMHIAADQVIGEGEGVGVLADAVFVGYNAEGGVVLGSYVGFPAGDFDSGFGENGAGDYVPVQSGEAKGFSAGGGGFYAGSEGMPGLFSYVHHRFYVVCHMYFSFYMLDFGSKSSSSVTL